MLVNLYTFTGTDEDGGYSNTFASAAERDRIMDEAAREKWEEFGDGDYPDGDPRHAWNIITLMGGGSHGADILTLDAPPVVPSDPVAAARAAAEALRYARDCLASAGADRAKERVKDALASALGAMRHAEGKAVR
ncbi:MAG: hypothetical protein EOS72_03170 [Mesorhizobium sp.]|uniref:hypothetical protein n=1 Tax=Mesorhizobium sp. TaxID=1871066 RepID=UPI000FE61ECC|nr:hypothetical protein [Mesorhizobium sp.]RWC91670.1 MAG: hypothetical protein EOS72_03170 [Mesorhizobium sp.]